MHGWFVVVAALPPVQCSVVGRNAAHRHDVLVRRVCRDAVLRHASPVQAVPPVGVWRHDDSGLGHLTAPQVLQRVQVHTLTNSISQSALLFVPIVRVAR